MATQSTGAQDKTYNLVSILYHALQGAETYQQYIRDAEQSGDQDLVQFFRQVQEEERRRAERAKQLLGQRLGQR
jgi:rubrerythrin